MIGVGEIDEDFNSKGVIAGEIERTILMVSKNNLFFFLKSK
jgi:hypothetical protein